MRIKKTLVLAFTMMLTLSLVQKGLAQKNRPLSTDKYNRCIRSIKENPNSLSRYGNALEYFSNEYCTTKQLQEVCYYLSNDQSKYELCREAYPNVMDKDNFFNIYDSFSTFSSALKLYHATQGGHKIPVKEPVKVEPPKQDPDELINSATFELLVKRGDKLLANKQFMAAIVVYDEARILKPNDERIHSRLKEAARLKKQSEGNKPLVKEPDVTIKAICKANDVEFISILRVIKDKIYAIKQKEMAKTYIAKKCFSVDQYKQIVSIFKRDDYKLELIKYIADYTNYPHEMYSFRELLVLSSSKNRLDKFLIDRE